ncbi:DUF305 domain-containing protein [Burkholderia sp. 22PA0106]|uniref:CopM family metallochaperone n=1 Tax=Burkholderia sp. 22PA0106 TaxID=3237371 RepID=UPI0039C49EED
MKIRSIAAVVSIAAGIALIVVPGGVYAQQADSNSMKMAMPGDAKADASPATQAFERNAKSMMSNMSAPGYTGDPDADFVAHMIPHHQGAVDQAEVELKYGKDPQMRALAGRIVKAQKDEIALMKRWQVKHHSGM